MKAEILADGTLVIKPETPTEAYALRCWHNEKPSGVIHCDWDITQAIAASE